MKILSRVVTIILGIATVVIVCYFALYAYILFVSPAIFEAQVKNLCSPPPTGFTEKDLIGTWIHPNPDTYEQLIIRGDGKYKQITHIDHVTIPDEDYESGWQSWRLENANGLVYLYLEGMRTCAFSQQNCNEPSGERFYMDFCRNEAIVTDNEVVMVVLPILEENRAPNDHRAPTRWINLSVLLGYEQSFGYGLQEP